MIQNRRRFMGSFSGGSVSEKPTSQDLATITGRGPPLMEDRVRQTAICLYSVNSKRDLGNQLRGLGNQLVIWDPTKGLPFDTEELISLSFWLADCCCIFQHIQSFDCTGGPGFSL